MIVADAAQATVNRRDGEAIHKIDHIAQNNFRRGGQGAALVRIAPCPEVFPVRCVGIERIAA